MGMANRNKEAVMGPLVKSRFMTNNRFVTSYGRLMLRVNA